FTLQGGITVSLRERAEAVELVVGDTGVGIPASDLPGVFERFHRVRGVEGRTHEGTGIGLALVAELVKLHGGRVTVESELGRGSPFRVTIPTGSAHLPAERIGARRYVASTALGAMPYVEEALRWLSDPPEHRPFEVPEPLTAISTAGGRVLLADDNADMRGYVARLLRPYWDLEAGGRGRQGSTRGDSRAPARSRSQRRDDAPSRRAGPAPGNPLRANIADVARDPALGTGGRRVAHRGSRARRRRLLDQAFLCARAHCARQRAPRDGASTCRSRRRTGTGRGDAPEGRGAVSRTRRGNQRHRLVRRRQRLRDRRVPVEGDHGTDPGAVS